MAIIAFHQADIGEYLRSESNLIWTKKLLNLYN
jgi:hypothetical protein